MDGAQASRLHASLAQALANVWTTCPQAQAVLHSELGQWQRRQAPSEKEFFRQIYNQFTTMSVESTAINALQTIESAFDDLGHLFIKLRRYVRRRYMDLASWCESDVPVLVTAWVVTPLYPDVAPFGTLGAAACVPPRKPGYPTEVKLTFAPSLLGPPSWAAVPYLLCHELVCHVSQGAPMDSGDPFAEGWMDHVAHTMHGRLTSTVLPWDPGFAGTCAEELRLITSRRGPGIHDPHDTTRAARQVGWKAAMIMQGLLKLAGAARPEAALEQLSLQLNRLDSTVAARLDFVAGIANCGGSAPAQLLRRRRLRELLGRWLAGEIDAREVLSFT